MAYEWTIEHPHEPGIHALSPAFMTNTTGFDGSPIDNTDFAGQFDGNVYKIGKVDERHNDMIVRCTVHNMFGSGQSETHVRVMGKSHKKSMWELEIHTVLISIIEQDHQATCKQPYRILNKNMSNNKENNERKEELGDDEKEEQEEEEEKEEEEAEEGEEEG